jgi:hypothetical protein
MLLLRESEAREATLPSAIPNAVNKTDRLTLEID